MTEHDPDLVKQAVHPAAALLRDYCRREKVSMRALSLSIGRGEKFVADIVGGRSHFPDPRTLAALADKTGIPIEALSHGTAQAPHAGIAHKVRAGLFMDAVIDAVEVEESLKPGARKDIADDVRHFCSGWLKKEPAAVPADPHWLRNSTKDWTHQTFAISRKRWNNVNWSVKKALEIARVIPVDRKPIRSVGAEWAALHDSLKEVLPWPARKLSPFIRYCDAFGIAPDAVSNETLEAFAAYRDAFDLSSNIAKKIEKLRSAWNRAVDTVADWPRRKLAAGKSRINLNLPEEAFLPSFREDVERYVASQGMRGYDVALAGTHLDRARIKHKGAGSGRKKPQPLGPRTLKEHRDILYFAASAAIRQGILTIEDIHEIADVADCGIANEVTEDIEMRVGLSSQYAGNVVKVLGSIAMRWVQDITSDELDDFAALKAEMNESAESLGRLSTKDRLRLAPFLSSPENMGTLLALPWWIFENLEKLRGKGTKVTPAMALKAQSAVAILIEQTLPVRWGDLGRSAFDVNIILPKQRNAAGTLHYRVSKTQEKGVRDVQAALSPEKVRLLEIYRRHYRPVLTRHDPSNPYLFPGTECGAAKSYGQLSRQVKTLVHQATGYLVNGHLWRKLMGGYLLYQTQDMKLVRALLGHTPNSTATHVYVEFQTAWAAAELDKHVTRLVQGAVRPRTLRRALDGRA